MLLSGNSFLWPFNRNVSNLTFLKCLQETLVQKEKGVVSDTVNHKLMATLTYMTVQMEPGLHSMSPTNWSTEAQSLYKSMIDNNRLESKSAINSCQQWIGINRERSIKFECYPLPLAINKDLMIFTGQVVGHLTSDYLHNLYCCSWVLQLKPPHKVAFQSYLQKIKIKKSRMGNTEAIWHETCKSQSVGFRS